MRWNIEHFDLLLFHCLFPFECCFGSVNLREKKLKQGQLCWKKMPLHYHGRALCVWRKMMTFEKEEQIVLPCAIVLPCTVIVAKVVATL